MNGIRIPLKKLADIKHGYAFKGEFFTNEQHETVLVTPGNFSIGGGFQADKLKYYDGPYDDDYVLSPNDLIVTMTDLSKMGDTLGYPAFIPDDQYIYLHNQRIGKVLLKNDNLDKLYLYYVLRSRSYRNFILGSATGSTVKHTSPARILNFEIWLPAVKQQKTIAQILWNLDQKIELNRQMNETLEQMAQAVFQDWFVDFGPVKRKLEGINDPVAILGGLIPDPVKAQEIASFFPDQFAENGLPRGWAQSKLRYEFNVTMGQSPPGSTYNEINEGLPFFQGRRDFGFRFPENRVYCNNPLRIAEKDWTLISVRAPVGDINRSHEKSCIGRGVGSFIHKSGLASYTYYYALALKRIFEKYDSNGTVFGSISKNQLEDIDVLAPDPSIVQTFDNLVTGVDQLILNNTDQNQTLAEMRDLLLPKLMSGEISVDDLEKKMVDVL